MRWFVLVMVVAFAWAMQVGCAANQMSTVTETRAERSHAYRAQADLELRELNDDLETFLLMDHPSHLTKWNTE